MSREPHSADSRISTDPDTIRSWSERHTLVPVRRERDGESHLDIVSESAADGDERLSWGEFRTELRREDQVVVHRGDRPEDIDVLDRTDAVGRVPFGDDDVAEALFGGETVETEVTEQRVVEHVVVEEVTIESEIVDREVVQSKLIDVDLLSTDVDHATVTRTEAIPETPEAFEGFQPGTRTDENYDVEIAVTETWSLTREVVERVTIESRIVRTDVEDTTTVESDTLRETVDLEGVTETVIEGELVASPETATEAVERGHVESQFREDDAIETHLIRRQTVDEEMSVDKEITGEISDAETLSTEAITHTVVESEISDADEYGVDLAAVDVDRERATADARAETAAEGTETTAEGTATTASPETTVTPTGEEEGKKVVNSAGDEIGMVTDVENGTMYVDPHPSLTDRIRSALGWGGDHDEDAYAVDNDDVARIEEDRVVLGVDRET